MSNLLNLNEAARYLGISVEKLKDLRARNLVSAVRVGSDWKFKQSELNEAKKRLASLSDASDPSDFELSDSSGGDAVLVDDSDESVEMAKAKDSGHVLEDDEISFGESSLDLAAGSSGKLLTGDHVLDDGPESDEEPALSTGKLLGGDDDISLIDESSDSDSPPGSSEMSSDFDDDSELELDDSDSSAELQLNKGNKAGNGDDFALSDDVLELGGSDIDDFELSDSSDLISLVDSAEQDAATLMQDDDFNLTPMEDSESDDTSGSQVIALEESDLFADDAAATQLHPQGFAPQPGLMPATGFESSYAQPAAVATVPEVNYTGLQVLALGGCALVMLLGGVIAYEIARNMWMPDDQVLRTGFLQSLMDLLAFD
ncbi:MAG TPA: helix-turn-helix domain-containing protein [Pirellulaceae bacterium]|nr:helix-turn-helix domain-containing protein [Pirellulaceae bacterium]